MRRSVIQAPLAINDVGQSQIIQFSMRPIILLPATALLAAVAGCATAPVKVSRAPVRADAHFTIPHLELSQVDVSPKATSMVLPRPRVRNPDEGLGGYAVVDFIVDAAGIPREVQWVEASDELFGSLAARAMAESRFRPAQKGGKAVAALVEHRYEVRTLRAYAALLSDHPPRPSTIWLGNPTGSTKHCSRTDPFDRGTYCPQSGGF